MIEPSFLLVDAGSTRLKWATARSRGKISVAGEIATRQATASRISALAREYPRHRLVLASVVPKVIPPFRSAFAGRIHVVSGTSPALGLRFDYPRPAEIGADRLAIAVAAQADGPGSAIAIACGTATAFTVLDAKGRLCGGVIAPGLQTQLASLLAATAQLPETKLGPVRRSLARSSQEAIRAGVVLNFQGGAKEILARLLAELPSKPRPRLLLTGGNASLLAPIFGSGVKLRPLLVFEGLRIIGIRAFSDRP